MTWVPTTEPEPGDLVRRARQLSAAAGVDVLVRTYQWGIPPQVFWWVGAERWTCSGLTYDEAREVVRGLADVSPPGVGTCPHKAVGWWRDHPSRCGRPEGHDGPHVPPVLYRAAGR